MLRRQRSPDDQNALIDFLSSFPQRVLSLLFVHAAFLGIPFWRKIEVVGSRSRQCAHVDTCGCLKALPTTPLTQEW